MSTTLEIEVTFLGFQETADPDVYYRLYNVLTTQDPETFPIGTTISDKTMNQRKDTHTFFEADPVGVSMRKIGLMDEWY